jgi:plastocyanin
MKHPKRTAAILGVGGLLLLAPACGSSSAGGRSDPTTSTTGGGGSTTGTKIVIKDYDYVPKRLTVKAGAVTVENDDGTEHSVTADDESFDTGRFSSGSETLDVTKPGTYTYHCSVHPFMTGTIDVE